MILFAYRWRTVPFACLLPLLVCVCGSESAWAHPAWGIQMNRQGELYFADAKRNRIWLINVRGSLIPVLKGKHSYDLWLDQADNIYGEHVYFDQASQAWRREHWQLTINEHLTELGAPESAGTRLLRDAQGNSFIVESSAQQVRLLKRSPKGAVTFLAGGPPGHADGLGAAAQFTLIEALALGPDDALYLRDQTCIRRVSPTGAVTTVGGHPLAGVARGPQPRILGLATDTQGNVFVADAEQHALRKIDPAGRTSVRYHTGWFWEPAGVAVVNQDLYVLQSAPESLLGLLPALGLGPYLRVQKLAADGSVQTLATVWGPTTRIVFGITILLIALFALWQMRRRETRREVLP